MTKRTVYPVEGRYLSDVPAVEHECDDPRCVESGAFTEKRPPRAAKPEGPPEGESPNPVEA